MFRTKLGMLAKVTPMMKHPKRPEKKNSWTFMMSKLVFNLAGYNRYGLYSDDVIYHDSPVVKEALRRLPKEVLDARNFRYITRVVLITNFDIPRISVISHICETMHVNRPLSRDSYGIWYPGAYGRRNWTF